ncbi:division/cell wall cluster transcriptional repressor MraZ [Frigidibacter oleivorans]|uniref:division/cell wall cluster transcriptional repressor MraZ n=1 Tax=Frigidibacter oleivorans TaxID=2487129 RepID=UPI000F8F0F69|nr:division/cell wall cluster transcriptional repressor MraZ [Frigidibacter oleivorans]
MAGMFIGEYTFKVDGKGRMSIPADYRRELEQNDPDWTEGLRPKIAVVYGGPKQSYLECHTAGDFKALAAEIAAMERGSMERRILERMVLGAAVMTEIDPDGRLVLPQRLREKIALDGEAKFIGGGQTFQIWKPETFEAEDQARIDSWLGDRDDDFDIYSLLAKKGG